MSDISSSMTLAALRTEIDAVDDAMFALIEKRCEFVAKVGELKQTERDAASHDEDRCFIRPGREGAMLQRIWERFADSPFNPAGAVSMWRDVINASITMETPLRLCIAANENDVAFWRARHYFGQFMPVESGVSVAEIVATVERDPCVIGIVPYAPDEKGMSDDKALCAALEKMEKSYLFAQLPFVEDKASKGKALALARIRPETSGKDMTYVLRIASGAKAMRLERVDGFYVQSEKLIEEAELSVEKGEILRIVGHSTVPRKMRMTEKE